MLRDPLFWTWLVVIVGAQALLFGGLWLLVTTYRIPNVPEDDAVLHEVVQRQRQREARPT